MARKEERSHMKMKDHLCPEEAALSYSKYYYLPLDPPDPMAMQLINEGSQDPAKALTIDHINDLFQPGYLPIEMGYTMMPDGSAVIANYVRMPGVTIDMIDWWFCWHWFTPPSVPPGNGNLRYKLWNPKEHWDTGADEASQKRLLDESLPWRLRRAPATNYIHESVDYGEIRELDAWGLEPQELGVDLEVLKQPNMGTVITACLPIDNPAVGIHYYRPVRDGVELRTRYWFGWAVVDGVPQRIPESMPSEELVRNFTIHNATEYPHLAAFLPSLYREESWKPLAAY